MRIMKWSLRLAVAVLAIGLALSAPQRANVLFSQPWDGTGSLYASQNDTNGGGFGNFATVYDNFTLGASATITSVDWVGGYYNGSPSAISGFTLSIWGDSGGQPGALLATTSAGGNAGETLVSGNIYSYSLGIAGFAATGGSQYWLSIVPDIGFPPQWGWATSIAGDLVGYQDFFGTRSQVPTDFAFTLNGTAAVVPEPSTLAIAALGALGFVVTLRRRRAAA